MVTNNTNDGVGWQWTRRSVSLLPVTIYGSIRAVQEHGSCWVHQAGLLEWLIYGPQLLCILLNVFFFVFILRILITEIQSHPNEPSNYRRALKATFLLVPLFGLQLFLVSFSPRPSMAFEVAAKLLSTSQGAVVAIIFCFSNSEVHSEVRGSLSAKCCPMPSFIDRRRVALSSHVAADVTRSCASLSRSTSRHRQSASVDHADRTNYIALHIWGNDHPNTLA